MQYSTDQSKINSHLEFLVAIPLLSENYALGSISGSTCWGYSWLPCEGRTGVVWSRHPHTPGLDWVTVQIPQYLAHLAAPFLSTGGRP